MVLCLWPPRLAFLLMSDRTTYWIYLSTRLVLTSSTYRRWDGLILESLTCSAPRMSIWLLGSANIMTNFPVCTLTVKSKSKFYYAVGNLAYDTFQFDWLKYRNSNLNKFIDPLIIHIL